MGRLPSIIDMIGIIDIICHRFEGSLKGFYRVPARFPVAHSSDRGRRARMRASVDRVWHGSRGRAGPGLESDACISMARARVRGAEPRVLSPAIIKIMTVHN